jgi:hypothetical protein
MAAVTAIYALTNSLASLLTQAYQVRPISGVSCTFSAIGTTDMKKLDDQTTTCAIFLYRVTHNEFLRNRVAVDRVKPLSVNLHLMVSVWSDTPMREQSVLAWVLRELHQRPVLDRSVLPASDGFTDNDLIQLTPEEITATDMSTIWQVFVPPYRVSLTYVARNLSIDLDPPEVLPAVVATRFAVTDDMSAEVST